MRKPSSPIRPTITRVGRSLGAVAVGAGLIFTSACGGGGSTPATGTGSGFDAAAYFEGKTIQVIVTHSAGGGTDLFGRFVATRLSDKIPGHPRVSVTNKGGAGGMTDVVKAPEEELVVGVTSQGSALYLAAQDPEAGFAASDVHFIGSTGGEPRSIIGYGDIAKAFNTFTDAIGKPEPTFKSAGTVGGPVDIVSDAFMVPWLCENLRLSCKLFSVADDDSSDLNLMIERGEMNLQSGTLVGAIRDHSKELADGSAKIYMSFAEDPHTTVTPPPGVKVLPATEALPQNLQSDYARILPVVGGGNVGRSFWAGPNIPTEVLDVLRTAYTGVVSDPAVVTEMQSVLSGGADGYVVSAVNGADSQKAYEAALGEYTDNQSYYGELQQKYWDKYWNAA
jgi:hypothetical protein